jgi:signal transduction histidine kinase
MTPKEALRQSPLFSQLSDGELNQVAAVISERRVEPGEMLIREGDEGYSLFILEEGHVDVLRSGEHGQPARISELGEGAMFGEMSFIEHGPVSAKAHPARSAAVVAHDRVKVLELRFDALETLAEADPVLGVKLYRTLAVSLNDKLKNTTDHLLPLVASARLAALGQMTANIAHELGNPLAVLQALSAGISEGMAGSRRGASAEDAELGAWAEKIGSTVAHVGRVISALRSVSRDGSGDPLVHADSGAIVRETLGFCEERFRHYRITTEVLVAQKAPTVKCRPVQVSQALLNLLNNSVDAIAALPTESLTRLIRVSVEMRDSQVVIAVEDSGIGVSPMISARIFKPFFTTKPLGLGTGLGLSLSRQLIEANGGTLSLEKAPKLTRFEVRLSQ